MKEYQKTCHKKIVTNILKQTKKYIGMVKMT